MAYSTYGTPYLSGAVIDPWKAIGVKMGLTEMMQRDSAQTAAIREKLAMRQQANAEWQAALMKGSDKELDSFNQAKYMNFLYEGDEETPGVVTQMSDLIAQAGGVDAARRDPGTLNQLDQLRYQIMNNPIIRDSEKRLENYTMAMDDVKANGISIWSEKFFQENEAYTAELAEGEDPNKIERNVPIFAPVRYNEDEDMSNIAERVYAEPSIEEVKGYGTWVQKVNPEAVRAEAEKIYADPNKRKYYETKYYTQKDKWQGYDTFPEWMENQINNVANKKILSRAYTPDRSSDESSTPTFNPALMFISNPNKYGREGQNVNELLTWLPYRENKDTKSNIFTGDYFMIPQYKDGKIVGGTKVDMTGDHLQWHITKTSRAQSEYDDASNSNEIFIEFEVMPGPGREETLSMEDLVTVKIDDVDVRVWMGEQLPLIKKYMDETGMTFTELVKNDSRVSLETMKVDYSTMGTPIGTIIKVPKVRVLYPMQYSNHEAFNRTYFNKTQYGKGVSAGIFEGIDSNYPSKTYSEYSGNIDVAQATALSQKLGMGSIMGNTKLALGAGTIDKNINELLTNGTLKTKSGKDIVIPTSVTTYNQTFDYVLNNYNKNVILELISE